MSDNYKKMCDDHLKLVKERFSNQCGYYPTVINEPSIKELKESVDELVQYLKPYHGNLLVGKSAVDEYENLLRGEYALKIHSSSKS